MKNLGLLFISCFVLAACAPEIGSKEWCDNMKDKPKGEWTANEARDFAKHCLFSNGN